MAQPQMNDAFDQWLDLSVRLRHALEATDRKAIGDLCDMTPEQVLGLPNIGRTNLRELQRELAPHGLVLRPGPSPRVAWKNSVDLARAPRHSLEWELERL